MNNKDFQNGLIVGLAKGGVVEQEYILPIGGDELGGVKNGGNVAINADGTMTAPVAGGIDYDLTVKGINHRGYNTIAPENTIPAYQLAKKNGFYYVECDVSFTSDGVCVLLHDSTIDRTSNGRGSISSMTYEEVSQYDFGSWKSAEYANTKIPTFDEFLLICKRLGLHPYIEIKNDSTTTQSNVESIVNSVKLSGMKGSVSYISFNATYLGYVKNVDPEARLAYVVNDISSSTITTATDLKTDTNEVVIDCNYSSVTDNKVSLCANADLPLEVWTVNSEKAILDLNPYITGVTSDSLIAGKVLYNAAMVYEDTDTDNGDNNGGDTGSDNENEITFRDVVELTASDLKNETALVYTYPYFTPRNTRVSYVDFDIGVKEGELYRFEYVSPLSTTQMGLQFHSQEQYDIMLSQGNMGNPVYDPGWIDGTTEITIPTGKNIVCVRLAFRADTNNSVVPDDLITSVKISKVTTNG